jgi:ferric hydroxamate transport system ATP-binding protein
MITLEQVQFQLGSRTLLHPLDLQLPHGQVCGLIGHNGSGKSTLVKLLARQQVATAGRIRLDGRDLGAYASREFAQRVAYLPQQPASTDQLTVQELVRFGRQPWHGLFGRFGDADRQAVARAMALTQVEAYAHRLVESLSGGERQRVWLAALIAQQTRYLLLDEPTSALDVAHQVEVLALIRQLSHELELGVVVVLHDINMAARYCDQLVALRDGRLLVQGTPQQLMTAATLEHIYRLPMQVVPHPVTGEPVSLVL